MKRKDSNLSSALLILLLIFISACQEKEKESDKFPQAVFSEPEVVAFNPAGYSLNQITGDSIHNPNPDFKKSELKFQLLDSSSYSIGQTQEFQFTIHSFEDYKSPISESSIETSLFLPDGIKKTFPVFDKNSFFITPDGDTVPTGISVPYSPYQVVAEAPDPIESIPPRFRADNQFNLIQYSTDEGLPGTFVWSSLVDQKGNLWIGMEGTGVSMYDGERYYNYTTENGLSSNIIFCILEDSRGNIWFGTWGGGAIKFDGNKFTHYNSKHGFNARSVWSIIEDKSGAIWLGTNNCGLAKIDGEYVTYFTQNEGLPGNSVYDLVEDSDDNIWVVGDGITMYDCNSFSVFTDSSGVPGTEAESILEDSYGNIWFSSLEFGLIKFDGIEFSFFSEESGLRDIEIYSMATDPKGNIYMETFNQGMVVYEGDEIISISPANGMPDNPIFSIFISERENIWIGTGGGGLIKIKEKSFENISKSNGLISNSVKALEEDFEGNKWIGHFGEGISLLKNDQLFHLDLKNGLLDNFVNSLYVDRSGKLWAGTNSGISVIDQNTIYNIEMPGIRVFEVTQDYKGDYWIATNKLGLLKYDGNNLYQLAIENNFTSNYIKSIIEDSKGRLWVGTTSNGITLIESDSFLNITEREGLSDNDVNCLLEDCDGNIWIGTEDGGLNRFDGESFTYYTSANGLSNNFVTSIIEDYNDNIWVGTDQGLTLLYADNRASNEDKINYRVIPFGKGNGLAGLTFAGNAVNIDRSNTIRWGTNNGITSLNLNKFKVQENPPELQFRNLSVNGHSVNFQDEEFSSYVSNSDSLSKSSFPSELELPFKYNHLTFNFSASDWAAPHKVLYTYRIKDLDARWSPLNSDAKADYRNLPYGTHTFEVKAISEAQVWTESLTYTFTILPPWYHTWWARLSYLLIGLSIILLYIRWRVSKFKERQKELEYQIAIATEDLRQANSEITKERDRSEELLLNILPAETATELKEKGFADAKEFEKASILFADIKGFTEKSSNLTAAELVAEIDTCFKAFDQIISKFEIEKIKTIGDAYMAAAGLPNPDLATATDMVKAALEMQKFIADRKIENQKKDKAFFEIRVGIHTGPVIAGIAGVKKFQYDIWGDTVNIASRMETNCEVGKVNISSATYELISENSPFEFEKRGQVEVKGKGMMQMYYVSFA